MVRNTAWKPSILNHPLLGRVDVTHRSNHDPLTIVNSILTPSIRNVNAMSPRITVHRFPIGPRRSVELAVRHELDDDLRRRFGLFQEMSGQALFDEIPVAIIQMPREVVAATIWKPSTSLEDFMGDPAISVKQKAATYRLLLRKLARMHAAGYRYGHLRPNNVVVDKKGNPSLIDWTRLLKVKPVAYKKLNDQEIFLQLSQLIARMVYSCLLGARGPLSNTANKKLTLYFSSIYSKAYNERFADSSQ